MSSTSRPEAHPAQGHRFTGAAFDLAGLDAAAAALMADPRFDAALVRFCDAVIAGFEGHWLAHRLMGDAGRFGLMAGVFHLEAERLAGRRPEGVTTGGLVAFMERRRLASRRSVQAMVAFLRVAGALVPMAQRNLGRQRPLAPSDAMRETALRWLGGNLEGIAGIAELPAPGAELARRPGFMEAYFTAMAAPYVARGFILFDGMPPVEAMMTRSGGYVTMIELMRTARTGADGTILAEAPHGALAARLLISRSQARALTALAEREGWLKPLAPGGRAMRLSPEFHQTCRHWIAREIAWSADLAHGAAAEI
jgi:hypothetical protein